MHVKKLENAPLVEKFNHSYVQHLFVQHAEPDIDLFNLFSVCMVRSREEPYFSKSPKDVNVVLGKSITLPCEVTPNIGIKYYWQLNGKWLNGKTCTVTYTVTSFYKCILHSVTQLRFLFGAGGVRAFL